MVGTLPARHRVWPAEAGGSVGPRTRSIRRGAAVRDAFEKGLPIVGQQRSGSPGESALRPWLAWAGTLAGLALLVAVATDALAQDSDRTGERSDADTLTQGGELYQRWCAVCHATDGGGGRDGPPLSGLDLAYIDLTMRTGRMPFPAPDRGVRDHDLDDAEREAVVAYLADLLELDGEIPDPPPGHSAARGQELYTVHCAACHGATGSGGVSGGGATVPGVLGLDRTTLASATRVGPFDMPAFGEDVIDDAELGELVDYLTGIGDHPSRTVIGLVELNRVTAAAAGALLLLALVYTSYRVAQWRQPAHPAETADERDEGAPR